MTTIKGNLLNIEKGFIFQQVNCQGAYGAGLSGDISKRWPLVEKLYRESFKHQTSGDTQTPDFEWLGECVPISVTTQITICNVYGQLYYGGNERQTDYSAIVAALRWFNGWIKNFKNHEEKELRAMYSWPKYFPKFFGAGLAKGDPKTIHRIIEHYIPDAILVQL